MGTTTAGPRPAGPDDTTAKNRSALAELGLDPSVPPTLAEWPAVYARLAKLIHERDESEALSRTLQNTVTDAVLVMTPGGDAVSYNSRFADLWRIPERGAMPSLAELRQHVLREVKDPAAFGAQTKSLREAPEELSVDEFELADGRVIERYIVPVTMPDGAVRARVGCFRDVTATRRVAAQRAVLAERMASVGQLVATVVHDINNPLTSVAGNVEVVLSVLRDGGPAASNPTLLVEALEDACIGVDRIRVLVRDLRTLFHVDEETRAPADVRALLESALDKAAPQLRGRATVVRKLASVPLVAADAARLTQVFLNLLINAAQAVVPVEGRVADNTITVVSETTWNGDVRVEVRDTGPGIPPEKLERVFDPSFTISAGGPAAGLRLSLCKSIVEKLGGVLRIASVYGHGASFTVELPAASPRSAPKSRTTGRATYRY